MVGIWVLTVKFSPLFIHLMMSIIKCWGEYRPAWETRCRERTGLAEQFPCLRSPILVYKVFRFSLLLLSTHCLMP